MKQKRTAGHAQIGLFDGLIVDNFAGAGGASVGIELAMGRPVSIAVNHDEAAVMLHRENHPWTRHFREDVFAVDPVKECGGKRVRLAWFSPDCKHFSRAKGAALVDRKIRGLAWVVLRWAGTVHPDVILLENVPEFVTWGPVRKGKPVKSKAGQTYRKWYKQLSDLGYRIETRELCAANYGVPTIRTRFYLIARRDGQPIRWPQQTHGKRDSEAVRAGNMQPWKPAADCIDWSLPCYSIFESKEEIRKKHRAKVVRPLAENTMARVARGLDKFVVKSAEPFIVPNNTGNTPRPVSDPVPTVTTGGRNILAVPFLNQHKFNNVPQDVESPLTTVTAVGAHELVSPCLIQYHTEREERVRGQAMTEPLMTVDASNRYGLIAGYLTQYFGGEGHFHSVSDPLATATTKDRENLAAAYLTEYFGNAADGLGLRDPLHTVTARDREGLTIAHIHQFFGGADGTDARAPLPTVTSWDHNALELAHLAHFKGNGKAAGHEGQDPREPMRTVTAVDGQFAEVRTVVVRAESGAELFHWPEVRELLNRYCGYGLKADEVLLIRILGAWYFISDVGLRMLTPRELARAMGFPDDYIIERFADGKPVPRSQQVAKIGNAVCPRVAEALVRANLPECAPRKFAGIDDLNRYMSV